MDFQAIVSGLIGLDFPTLKLTYEGIIFNTGIKVGIVNAVTKPD